MDRDWASLPCHLLDSILEKTDSTKDYLQFAAVCSSWRSIAKHNLQRRMESLSHEVPLLLIPSKDSHSHSLYDVTTCSFLESKVVVPFDIHFAGSSRGWLVVVEDDFSVTLSKPFAMIDGQQSTKNTTIRLPPVFLPEEEDLDDVIVDYHVHKAVISSDPLANPDHCVVMVIFYHGELACIRPKDAGWTFLDIEGYMQDIMYHNDKFYGLDNLGNLVSFKVIKYDYSSFKLEADAFDSTSHVKRYLVESKGKLLQVLRIMDWIFASDDDDDDDDDEDEDDTSLEEDYEIIERKTLDVIVCELDFDAKRWVELKSLGDIALFMGDNSYISVVASDFPGCKPNYIYFTHDYDRFISSIDVVNDFGVYDMENKCMDLHFGMHSDSLERISKRTPIWVVPTLNL